MPHTSQAQTQNVVNMSLRSAIIRIPTDRVLSMAKPQARILSSQGASVAVQKLHEVLEQYRVEQ
jgi:hypothetical protein